MRRGSTQASEKGMQHMFAPVGIGIAIGIGIDSSAHFHADTDSDPHTDSDPEISAISVLFSDQNNI